MNRVLTVFASVVIALHGLIHLMGAAAYLRLFEVQGLPYKTTVLGGRWDLGETSIAIFGALWVAVAIGFVSIAAGRLTHRAWWRPALVGVALCSLVLTVLDSSIAFAGVIVNVVILVALWLDSRVTVHRPWIHG